MVAIKDPQTGFEEEQLSPEQAVALVQALDEREAQQAEWDRADANAKLMAASLPDGIYRLGPWKVVVETETKTKVRITRPKR